MRFSWGTRKSTNRESTRLRIPNCLLIPHYEMAALLPPPMPQMPQPRNTDSYYGVFDSGDLVMVFQAGQYEHGLVGNSTFDGGDWNQDGDFDTSDLVFAFKAGTFVAAAHPASVAAAIDFLFGIDDDLRKGPAFVA